MARRNPEHRIRLRHADTFPQCTQDDTSRSATTGDTHATSFIFEERDSGRRRPQRLPRLRSAQAGQIRWRLASSFPKVARHDLWRVPKYLPKAFRTPPAGSSQISTHPANELVPAFGVVDAVQNATVECAHTAPYYFFGKDEAFAFDCAVPFGLNSRQQTAWMFEGNGMKLMREFLQAVFDRQSA